MTDPKRPSEWAMKAAIEIVGGGYDAFPEVRDTARNSDAEIIDRHFAPLIQQLEEFRNQIEEHLRTRPKLRQHIAKLESENRILRGLVQTNEEPSE